VDVTATVDKTKTITIDEVVNINKYVGLDARVITPGTAAAEADAIVNQVVENDYACENCAEKRAWIIGSVLGNTGITNVNQAVGNLNNQGNVVAVAVDYDVPESGEPPTPGAGGFANAQASVDQKVGALGAENGVNSYNLLYRDSLISGSIKRNIGITSVNQAAGQLNNQANTTAIAVCLRGAVALSEADLGQEISQSFVHEANTVKTAVIYDSVVANQGVTFVNQTSGNLGNQSNTLSLAASLR
jgi:hypothetical protein